ncbi:prolyl aminopeptidase [Candidatus Persebacteraceae bacterium Df01]|uniref:Proline iminopeptidase n=1 Tax=Candidatus Doriopsillibacter californiensis TaxID=2970740 RepID=A0ABT7QNE8_9GAMM|nr:prolyl aminopeptidase [Candidatus Persebacteraceae bacterium Df01]
MSVYPAGKPFNVGTLPVSSLHTLAFSEYGNPKGKPAVYLHGGPGAGSSPSMAEFFNPQRYRIVLFDQRGCGHSTPHAELRENTTWDLVADIEILRHYLKIDKWLVCGGSWGSSLALAYAQTHPRAVSEIIVRGIFTLRRRELLWFYQEGANWLFPDLWEEFIAPIPPAERGDIISAYHRRLTGDDEKIKIVCARAWSRWEAATLSFSPNPTRVEDFSDTDFALAFARIESHYFVNAGFFSHDGQLLDNAYKLATIPGVIVQGRYDVITPAKTAWELSRRWSQAKLILVNDAGHAANEPGIATAITEATDNFCR